jgi:hypothetical protein
LTIEWSFARSACASLRGAKRRSNPARAKRAKQKGQQSQQLPPLLFGAPAGLRLDCFAIGEAKRRRSSNGYGSQ